MNSNKIFCIMVLNQDTVLCIDEALPFGESLEQLLNEVKNNGINIKIKDMLPFVDCIFGRKIITYFAEYLDGESTKYKWSSISVLFDGEYEYYHRDCLDWYRNEDF